MKMLTFAPMVDSETTRLLLRHYGVAYDELDHLIIVAMLLAWVRSGNRALPLVYGPQFTLNSPFPLAQRLDAALPEAARLIPATPPLAAMVAADWKTFNDTMGTAVAVFSYFHLMPQRALMQPIFAAPLPRWEAWLTPLVYPLLDLLFTRALALTAQRATQAADTIRAAFAATDRRLADGRRYLCGDRLTLGDFGLAAAIAPLLQPPGYGTVMPPVDAMPEPVRALVGELRQHPTAAFVDRLYRDAFRTSPI